MDLGLDGKIALVTAASQGIGRAVALRMADEGARVVASSRPGAALDSLVGAAAGSRGRVSTTPTDLTDSAATGTLVDSVVAECGGIDILVINTPGPRLVSYLDTVPRDFADAYELLARPAIQLAGAAAKAMVAQGGGSIVFLTSTWVRQPAQGAVLSSSMRSLLSALAKQMATELAPRGVRVNQVMPGATGTDRMRSVIAHKMRVHQTDENTETREAVSEIPLGRWAEPDEIARYVAFVASGAGSFITGTAVAVDGGYLKSI